LLCSTTTEATIMPVTVVGEMGSSSSSDGTGDQPADPQQPDESLRVPGKARRANEHARPNTTDFHLSTLERLIEAHDQPGLASMWSHMVVLMVENKHRCGLDHLTDEKVAANAARVFHALLRICVDAKQAGPRLAHRLAAFGWFLDACRAEFEGRPELPTRH
jgi:hypothetical protein